MRQHYKAGIESHCYKKAPHLRDAVTHLWLKTTCENHDLVQSGKSSLKSWPDVKLIPQTNKQDTVGGSVYLHDTVSEHLVIQLVGQFACCYS